MQPVNRQADIDSFLRILASSGYETHPDMRLRTSIGELEELDRFLADIGHELTMPPGSIARVVWHALHSWTVGVTPQNVEWLMEKAEESILREWLTSDQTNNRIISKATTRVGLRDGNELLNGVIAGMVVDILDAMHENEPGRIFTLCDIGAGTGATSLAILNEMDGREHLAERCNFYMLELSPERVRDISQNLGDHPINNKIRRLCSQVITSSDSMHLPFLAPNVLDIVVSNAVFHHNSFPGYLLRIRNKMAKDGVLAFGDWHMSICQHPAFVVPLLEKLNGSAHLVGEFMDKFGVKKGDVERLEAELPKEERNANSIFRGYICEIGRQLEALRGENEVQVKTSVQERMQHRMSELIILNGMPAKDAKIAAAAELIACRPDGMSFNERVVQLGLPESVIGDIRRFSAEKKNELAELRKDGKSVPEMFFLEALETVEQKQRSLELAGFETDWDRLKTLKPFQGIRARTNVVGVYDFARNMTTAIAVGKMNRRAKKDQKGPRTSWTAAPATVKS